MDKVNKVEEVKDISYTGPRGKRLIEVFICHGCQTCLRFAGDCETIIDTGPHYLINPVDVTDKYMLKEPAAEPAINLISIPELVSTNEDLDAIMDKELAKNKK